MKTKPSVIVAGNKFLKMLKRKNLSDTLSEEELEDLKMLGMYINNAVERVAPVNRPTPVGGGFVDNRDMREKFAGQIF